MKICPKCNNTHQKCGVFCSRSCSNSRGPMSTATKLQISEKLKGRPSPRRGVKRGPTKPTKPVETSKVTGRPLYSDHWSYPIRATFAANVCKWFGIEMGRSDTSMLLDEIRDRVAKSYIDDKLSAVLIKQKYNIDLPDGHMPAFLKQLGIERRSLSSALATAYEQGRMVPPRHNKKYKSGWHLDFSGRRHYYRSSYELTVYVKLDEKRIKYDTESLRIPYYDSELSRHRTAIPDILIHNKIILEIKSSYRYEQEYANIISKFAAYKQAEYRPYIVIDGKFWWHLPDLNRCSGF